MKVENVKVRYSNPLVNNYLYNFSSVEGLFAFNPHSQEGFRQRYSTVLHEYNTDREELVRILLPYNRELGCGPAVEENISRLAKREAVVVITGQQAGVFTGPLYTIYKTISVIQLARQKSAELGVTVIPVFWVASEDHDFNEINHLDVINREGQLERLVLDEQPKGKFSVGHIPVSEAVHKMIEAFSETTNPAECKEGLIEELKGFARASGNLADWFARIMTRFFSDYGLVVVNPLLPGIRQMLAPLFEQFIVNSEQVNKAFQKGQQQVAGMGYDPQVEKSPDNLHLFRYIHGERLPLLNEGSGYSVRGRELFWTREELLTAAKEEPQQFSPNVVLRPIAQDYIFPLLAYVAGPGEISYYALYKEIYPIFDMSMPIIFPRANVTLLEGNIVKLMDKYGLDMGNISGGLDIKLKEYLKSLEDVDTERAFDNLEKKIAALFTEVTTEVSKIDPFLVKTGEEALSKVMHQVNYFMEKANQMHRKKNEVVIRQFEKISITIFPKNNYQERVFNIYPYLFKHGPALLEKMLELPLLEGVDHKLVYFNP